MAQNHGHDLWINSRDADDYFERLAEARDGHGERLQEHYSAEIALAAIDRVCSRQLLGEVTAVEAVAQITAIVGKWTDPDGPAGQLPRDPEFDPLQGPLPAGAGPVDDEDDEIPF